jgi:lipoprotein-anchoring transpeptidase ErfK/SrfK
MKLDIKNLETFVEENRKMGKRIFNKYILIALSLTVVFTTLTTLTVLPVSAQSPEKQAQQQAENNRKQDLPVLDNYSLFVNDTNKKQSTVQNSIGNQEIELEEKTDVKTDVKIVVNLPAYTLNFIENGKVIKTFPIAIAAPRFAEPLGTRQASHLIWNPSWTPPDSDWARNDRPAAPGSTGNPLGVLKIRIGGNYLIHGGGDKSVGRAASHGCIRMRNADVLELARLIIAARELPITEEQIEKAETQRTKQFGIKIDPEVTVEIDYRPVTVEKGQVEIHPDVYRKGTNNIDSLKKILLASGLRYENLSMEQQLSLVRALRDSKSGRQKVSLATESKDQIASN